MLADFLTVKEHFGSVEGLTLAYLGDGRNNVANSLLVTSSILGVNCNIVSPEAFQPPQDMVSLAKGFAAKSGSKIQITHDVAKGVKNADILYTDVWASMGEENELEERISLLQPYQINMSLIERTENKNVIVLHDLPAFHDLNTTMGRIVYEKFGLESMEITDEVFNSSFAHQFTQAENRLHTIKAIMAATLGNLFIPELD
jgi:ornithine carbamoyltransferase